MEKPISFCSRGEEPTGLLPSSSSRKTIPFSKLGFFYLRLLSGSIREQQQLICLRSDRLYTIGRKRRHCQIVFDHCCISRHHCQIFLDGADRSLRLVDGFLLSRDFDLEEIRRRLRSERQVLGFRVSLNGVFVNRRKLLGGAVAELSEGDEVVFGCGRLRSVSRCVRKYGFVVERIILSDFAGTLAVSGQFVTRADLLQNLCQRVLRSEDPVSYLRCSLELNVGTINSIHGVRDHASAAPFPVLGSECHSRQNDKTTNYVQNEKNLAVDDVGNAETSPSSLERGNNFCSSFSNGQSFFLNRLEFMAHDTSYQHSEVTLNELLDPVESLVQVFIATFTCDVSWYVPCDIYLNILPRFLSYCQIPNHLPVTIAFHSAEKCWSSSCDDRTSAPYSDYPNLLLVYPPFPDEIAFGKDRSKKGVACHHPKLLVLQREESVRVVVTSANLVSKQWNQITNTVWWQDFPRRDAPDYSSLFATIKDLNSDFAAQLAGFIASLITDVPSQAHWIKELARFDFGGAAAYLIASIPGMHALYTISSGINLFQNLEHVLPLIQTEEHIVLSKFTTSTKYLGSVQASVVGLRHRFHNAIDSRGEQLKKLALFLGKFKNSSSRLMEVVLKRNHSIPADANAISIFVSNLDEMSNGDSVQLGFLPRDVAKWAAPLVDHGFLEFAAFVCPKEALAAALDGNNTKGPKFSEMSRLIHEAEHLPALCLFIASIQRCLGLWRLKEVMSQYKWPEYLETDFAYEFSSAAGKKSFQLSESEESDPEWGCWSTDHEVKSPSIGILFPTIERVKSSAQSIQLSKYMLSFSENTWQRLKTSGILYDAVPNPAYRIGYPMHVKVARRRFQSTTSTSAFGWIYCGSHNFSPAAWGRLVPSSTVKGGSGAPANGSSGARLRICNYELGIILVIPPPSTVKGLAGNLCNLDEIRLPFVVPAPRYCGSDRPATASAMRGAMAECLNSGQLSLTEQDSQGMEEEDVADEEIVGPFEYIAEESEDENIYAEMLWSQLFSGDNDLDNFFTVFL
ncbi:hypothetical protein M5K25_008138 [Dendrobium thyrsiflorum]|uniref:FHA domain-containing protein n=1 Tax=Dendrobium thyrsiflorum TaxID=117978 RepID=A0ABD0VES2_DENTH